MKDIIQSIFENKMPDYSALELFGFKFLGKNYIFETTLPSSGFNMTVSITARGKISAKVTDPAFDEPYLLHLTDNASGSFVGTVRSEYEEILKNISIKCFRPDVFKSKTTKEIIDYAEKNYGDKPEYLWENFPNNAVLRRKDTGKWYAAILTVKRSKLGIDSDENTEIIDLRIKPENLDFLIDRKSRFPGYHMNKKHWYTILLDGTVKTGEICAEIDKSYNLAK